MENKIQEYVNCVMQVLISMGFFNEILLGNEKLFESELSKFCEKKYNTIFTDDDIILTPDEFLDVVRIVGLKASEQFLLKMVQDGELEMCGVASNGKLTYKLTDEGRRKIADWFVEDA